jgi:hypothetical protein
MHTDRDEVPRFLNPESDARSFFDNLQNLLARHAHCHTLYSVNPV